MKKQRFSQLFFIGAFALAFNTKANVGEYCLIATQNIVLKERAIVQGPMISNAYIEAGSDTRIYGGIYTRGNVLLKTRSSVNGNVEAGGIITKETGCYIQGRSLEKQQIDIVQIVQKSVPYNSKNVDIAIGQVFTLSPGTYGTIHVYRNATLKLPSGVYNLLSLVCDPDANIVLIGNNLTEINVKTNLTFNDRNNVSLENILNPLDVVFYTNQTSQIVTGCASRIKASLIAPNASVLISSRSVINGQVKGKYISVDQDARIELVNDLRFVDSDCDNVPDKIETELGTDPANSLSSPRLLRPSPWGATTDTSKNQFVTYTSPDGVSFNLEIPKGTVTSEYNPYVEYLDRLPGGDTLSLPPGEKLLSMSRLHGSMASGATLVFKFPFAALGQNVGNSSVRMYEYTDSLKPLACRIVTELAEATFVGIGGAITNILSIKDNVFLVNGSTTCTGGDCDGKTWETAYPSLAEAVRITPEGSELWVAKGIYSPGNTRDASFKLKSGTILLGGFDGRRNVRDIKNNITILSGDIGVAGDSSDNSFHIIECIQQGYDEYKAIIDGFTIKNGFANDLLKYGGSGAGVFIDVGTYTVQSSIDVLNCSFLNNKGTKASDGGGAIFITTGGDVTIDKCVFQNNTHISGVGGAIYNYAAKNLIITSCLFLNNSSDQGGAVFSHNTGVKIKKSVFSGNNVSGDWRQGGAFYGRGAEIENCTFANNFAIELNVHFTACGGALFLSGPCTVVNSILWNNSIKAPYNTYCGREVFVGTTGSSFSHNCVEGGVNGPKFAGGSVADDGTNISANPMFNDILDVDGPDNKLLTYDDGLSLRRSSPCIKRGREISALPLTDVLSKYIELPFVDIRDNVVSRYTRGTVFTLPDPDIGAYWSYLSECTTYNKIDFLPNKDHPFGFDRIVRNMIHTGNYSTPEDITKITPDEIYISIAFSGQGSDIPDSGLFFLVIDPSAPNNGKIKVTNPSTSRIKLKSTGGSLVDEIPWSGDQNIYSIKIKALNQVAGDANHIHNELNVVDSAGNVLRKLNVEVYKRNNKNAQFFTVFDSNIPSSMPLITPGTINDIQKEVNAIYSQAVTYFTFTGNTKKDIHFDKNLNGSLDYYCASYSSYPGMTIEQCDPENLEIMKALPPLYNTSIYMRSRIVNWVIVPNPETNQPPKAGDKQIFIYDADGVGPNGAGLGNYYRLGYSGSPDYEFLRIKPTRVDMGKTNALWNRIWRLDLKDSLITDHTVSIVGNSFSGETIWNYFAIAGEGFPGDYEQEIYINYFQYDVVAHELGHQIFLMGHDKDPEYAKLNLMAGTAPCYYLYKRLLGNESDNKFYSQWDLINGIK